MLFYQPTSGYCYNSDSIFLYKFISSFNPKGDLLDIGCGVGIISALIDRDFDTNTTIIDKQSIMLDYAKHNFYINSIETDAHLGNFISYKFNKKFNFIISNPPFYDSNSVAKSNNTHLNTARYSHHLPFEDLVKSVKKILKPRGWFIFCYDSKQIDMLMFVLKKENLNPEKVTFVYSKIDKDSKLVMIACRLGSKSLTQITAPLIVLDKNGDYVESVQEIFKKADTHSIKGDF